MPAHGFIKPTEIHHRLYRTAIQPTRLLELHRRFVESPSLQQNQPQIVVRRGEARVGPHGFPKGLFRSIELFLLSQLESPFIGLLGGVGIANNNRRTRSVHATAARLHTTAFRNPDEHCRENGNRPRHRRTPCRLCARARI